jgi:hypothetical protein
MILIHEKGKRTDITPFYLMMAAERAIGFSCVIS